LKLHLVLYNQRLAFVVNLGREFGGDGMMGGSVLDDKTFVAIHSRVDSGLLYGPLSDIGPILVAFGILFLGVRNLPPCLPVISELFDEGGFEIGRLQRSVSMQ
jgi:hypothetical protein